MAEVNSLASPKVKSVVFTADDTIPFVYAKYVGENGLTAGSEPDQATITVAADVITFQVASDGGALANDTGITYTGAAGAAGTITITDANANSPVEIAAIINGQGVGQTAFRRWRASRFAHFRPDWVITGGDALARSATNALVGRYGTAVPLFVDTSGVATATGAYSLGLGVANGSLGAQEGEGPLWPDYFEDIPGSSTSAGVNTPIRSFRKLEDNGVPVAQKIVKLTSFTSGLVNATSQQVRVYQLTAGSLSVTEQIAEFDYTTAAPGFVDLSRTPIQGRPGSPLWVVFTGAGAWTAGSIAATYEEAFA